MVNHRLMHAFVTSRLDQSNSLLYGLPDCEIKKLQRVLNVAARIVVKSNDCSLDILKSLHWLPVRARINYKILLLVFKVRNGLAPNYLADLLSDYTTGRRLRSTGKELLTIPRTISKSYGDRTFSVAGPKLWNALPTDLELNNH
ncbi:hypothetical protein QZH41_015707 [Actinostola sp. cb2023]|nr:hypothetical protein QZH41_015707 [Actinostola sp. cb2023]